MLVSNRMPARQLLVWDLMPYAAIFEVDFSRRKFPYKAGIQRRKKTDNIVSCRIYLKSWKTTQPSANFPQCNIRLRAWTDELFQTTTSVNDRFHAEILSGKESDYEPIGFLD